MNIFPKKKKTVARLGESANIGDWLESRLHMEFVRMVDERFGDGYLTRSERSMLLTALEDAMNAFNTAVQATAPQLYTRAPYAEVPAELASVVQEAETGEAEVVVELVEAAGDENAMFIPLLEGAVRRDGTIPVKIIQPGWGSSGYYPAEVLERDGPKVFAKGTKMFWNHQTLSEEAERPEGDLNDLAAELISDAVWRDDGPAGAGLYAEAKVFKGYRDAVDDLAPHIGLSIRTPGRVEEGEADGREGLIVTHLLRNARTSVDFVTIPGAGGQVVTMFEAARPRAEAKNRSLAASESSNPEEVDMDELQQLKEANAKLQKELEKARANAAELARLREAAVMNAAKAKAKDLLEKSPLPQITQVRLAEALSKNPPVKDNALDEESFAKMVENAIAEEAEYLQKLGAGAVTGLGEGGAGNHDEEALAEELHEAFRALGLSEEKAAIAAQGR